jgi:hypothetical protein
MEKIERDIVLSMKIQIDALYLKLKIDDYENANIAS